MKEILKVRLLFDLRITPTSPPSPHVQRVYAYTLFHYGTRQLYEHAFVVIST